MSKNPMKTVYSIYNGLEQAVSALVAAMIEDEAARAAYNAAMTEAAKNSEFDPSEAMKRHGRACFALADAKAEHARRVKEYEAFKATLPAVA